MLPFLFNAIPFSPALLANKTMIEDIAVAIAAQRYSSYIDRARGGVTHLGTDPSVPFLGSMKQQTSVTSESGITVNTIEAEPEPPLRSIRSLVSPTSQAALLKLKMI